MCKSDTISMLLCQSTTTNPIDYSCTYSCTCLCIISYTVRQFVQSQGLLLCRVAHATPLPCVRQTSWATLGLTATGLVKTHQVSGILVTEVGAPPPCNSLCTKPALLPMSLACSAMRLQLQNRLPCLCQPKCSFHICSFSA